MTDSFSDKTESQSSPAPAAEVKSMVGPMNTTFDTPAAEVRDEVEEIEEKSDSPPPPPPKAVVETTSRKGRGCGRDALLLFFSALLGAGLALLVLWGINGTLALNEREKMVVLESSQQILRSQQEQIEQKQDEQESALTSTQEQLQRADNRLEDLEARALSLEEHQENLSDELAAFYPRFTELDKTIAALQQDLSDTQVQIGKIEDQVAAVEIQLDEVEDQVAEVQEATERFDILVKGLSLLLTEINPQETPALTSEEQIPSTTPQAQADPLLELFPPQRPIPTPASDSGVIYGLAWLDSNENQIPEAGESPVAGVRVLLEDANGSVLLSMITGVDGRFAFINVEPGDYSVTAIAANGYTFTTDSIYDLTVHPGGSVEVDFGLIEPITR